MRLTTIVRIIAITGLLGCGRGADKVESNSTTTPAAGGDSTDKAPGSDVTTLFAGMKAHLDSLVTLPAERLPAALKGHDTLVTRVLTAVDQEMSDMGMRGGSRAWNALIDSLKSDIAELPQLSGPGLASRTEGHARRLRDMMDGHERMMKTMH